MSTRALRFYEEEGLIVSGRSANGYRDYCEPTLERVRVIRSLMEAGLPLKLVKDVLPYVPLAEGVCPAFLAQVQGYRDKLAERIASLTARQEALDGFLKAAGQGA